MSLERMVGNEVSKKGVDRLVVILHGTGTIAGF